jgi:hypothetical protein
VRFSILLPALACSISLSNSLCLAQAIYYLPPPQVKAAAKPGLVYVARVVDARPQHTSIGWVGQSTSLLPVPATFRTKLSAVLQDFFTQYTPGQANAVPLVLRLTGLEVGEAPDATAGVVADFYASQPDSSYRLVAHFAQMVTQPGRAKSNIPAALGLLLMDAALHSRDQAHWLPAGPSYPAAYVLASELHPAEVLPALAPDFRPRAGFYYTLEEFWRNQPSEPGTPDVEARPYLTTDWAGDLEVKPYRRTADGQRVLATNIWGFSDGKNFYLRLKRNFYKLERRGQGFIFYGRVGDDPAFRAAVAAKGNSGNSVLASAAAPMGSYGSSGLFASAATPSLERRAQFSFSLLTGSTSLDQGAIAPPLATRPTHLFVYRPRNAKGPAVRIRLAADQPAQELAAGDFLTFEPASDQPVQVYLVPATGPEVSVVITPTAEVPTYLECRPAEATPLRQVKDDAGAAAVTRLVR